MLFPPHIFPFPLCWYPGWQAVEKLQFGLTSSDLLYTTSFNKAGKPVSIIFLYAIEYWRTDRFKAHWFIYEEWLLLLLHISEKWITSRKLVIEKSAECLLLETYKCLNESIEGNSSFSQNMCYRWSVEGDDIYNRNFSFIFSKIILPFLW